MQAYLYVETKRVKLEYGHENSGVCGIYYSCPSYIMLSCLFCSFLQRMQWA